MANRKMSRVNIKINTMANLLARDTLEYAEAKNLLQTREYYRRRVELVDEDLRLLRKLCPDAVALAKQDMKQDSICESKEEISIQIDAQDEVHTTVMLPSKVGCDAHASLALQSIQLSGKGVHDITNGPENLRATSLPSLD
jgi:hypothetical protein